MFALWLGVALVLTTPPEETMYVPEIVVPVGYLPEVPHELLHKLPFDCLYATVGATTIGYARSLIVVSYSFVTGDLRYDDLLYLEYRCILFQVRLEWD